MSIQEHNYIWFTISVGDDWMLLFSTGVRVWVWGILLPSTVSTEHFSQVILSFGTFIATIQNILEQTLGIFSGFTVGSVSFYSSLFLEACESWVESKFVRECSWVLSGKSSIQISQCFKLFGGLKPICSCSSAWKLLWVSGPKVSKHWWLRTSSLKDMLHRV